MSAHLSGGGGMWTGKPGIGAGATIDPICLARILRLTDRDKRFPINCISLHYPETAIFIYFLRPGWVFAIHPQRGFGHPRLLLCSQAPGDERSCQPASTEWPLHTNALGPAALAIIELVLLVIDKSLHLTGHLVSCNLPGNLPQLWLKGSCINQPGLVIFIAWL